MADEHLRELERLYKEDDSEEAARAYLNERVRVQGWPLEKIIEDLAHGKTAKGILGWWDRAEPELAELPGVEVRENGYPAGKRNTVLEFGPEFRVHEMGNRARVELGMDLVERIAALEEILKLSCQSRDPFDHIEKCELSAGHTGKHRRGFTDWEEGQ